MVPHLSSGDATTWAFIRRLTDLASDVVDREVRAVADISGSDLEVLQLLVDCPSGILQQGEIAQALGWDKSRLSHQLTRMAHRGFVERVKSGRTHAVLVTREGLQRHELARSVQARAVREVLSTRLSPAERAALRETALAIAEIGEPPGDETAAGEETSSDAATDPIATVTAEATESETTESGGSEVDRAAPGRPPRFRTA